MCLECRGQLVRLRNARGLGQSAEANGVGQADIPVEVGGLVVNPGDLIHADMNGIVSIPHEILADLPAAIEEVLASERETLAMLHERGYDLEAHRKEIEH